MTTPATPSNAFEAMAAKTRTLAGEVALLAEGIRSGDINQTQAAALVDALAWDVGHTADALAIGAEIAVALDTMAESFREMRAVCAA